MNKKVMKTLSVLLITIMLISVSVSVFAADFDSVANTMKDKSNTNTEKISNAGGQIMGVLQTVGIVISIIILIVLGIKYMMGSAEEKAEYKKTMIPYLVGAVLIFGASAIAGVVVNFAQGITG